MLTYTEAATLLSRGRNGSKKVGNNTYLERIDSETIGVRLHSTFVVRIMANGSYSLHTGGWQTVTTKDRITAYSPARLFQERGEWYVGKPVFGEVPFVDGMTVNSEGVPL